MDMDELREMVTNLVHTVDQRREEMATVKKKAADLQSVVNVRNVHSWCKSHLSEV